MGLGVVLTIVKVARLFSIPISPLPSPPLSAKTLGNANSGRTIRLIRTLMKDTTIVFSLTTLFFISSLTLALSNTLIPLEALLPPVFTTIFQLFYHQNYKKKKKKTI